VVVLIRVNKDGLIVTDRFFMCLTSKKSRSRASDYLLSINL